MGKRLLIAVDDTDSSQRAVRYVGHMAGMIIDLQSVLLHVEPVVSQFVKDAARNDPETLEELLIRQLNIPIILHLCTFTILPSFQKYLKISWHAL